MKLDDIIQPITPTPEGVSGPPKSQEAFPTPSDTKSPTNPDPAMLMPPVLFHTGLSTLREVSTIRRLRIATQILMPLPFLAGSLAGGGN